VEDNACRLAVGGNHHGGGLVAGAKEARQFIKQERNTAASTANLASVRAKWVIFDRYEEGFAVSTFGPTVTRLLNDNNGRNGPSTTEMHRRKIFDLFDYSASNLFASCVGQDRRSWAGFSYVSAIWFGDGQFAFNLPRADPASAAIFSARSWH
jgi:hypothetical protein